MSQYPPAESQQNIVSGNIVAEFAIQINGPAVRNIAGFARESFTISGNVVKRGGVMVNDVIVMDDSGDSEDRGRNFLTALSELSALAAGNSDSRNPVINIKTWTPEHDEKLRYDTRENINEGGIMINGPIHQDKGFYAPGIWREKAPGGGGITIPWGIPGGFYVIGGSGVGTWGYSDIDSVGPSSRRIRDVDAPFSDEIALCDSCAAIPIDQLTKRPDDMYKLCDNLAELAIRAKDCRLCDWIFASSQVYKSKDPNDGNVQVSVEQPMSTRYPAMNNAEFSPANMRIFFNRDQPNARERLFPLLRERGSNEYFQLLNQWLRVCDEEHAHPKSFSAKLPTRVFDLGSVPSIANLRLHQPKGEEGTYVPLSHRWGDVQPYCTNSGNLASHCARIEFSELPKTFQDAIVVSYALGIRYLWIDSLCIIQDSEVDWEFECSQMEKVFAGAYCTLAATSAENCNDGFLDRAAKDSVKISDSRGHSWVLGDFREDFHHHVEEGKLNRRAWVLQERALSRRVFHFTDSQTYWECGSGIQCETVDWVDRSVDPFSSSEFPISHSNRPEESKLALFEDIYTRYTALGISYPTDRPKAILGLEARLALFYNSPSVYGVLTTRGMFGRTLLWERLGTSRMKAITGFKNEKVPSWSWMSLTGQINIYLFKNLARLG